MKTVAGVRVAAGIALAGLDFPNPPNPPIWQAQRPAATQKITHSFLRIVRLFAAALWLQRQGVGERERSLGAGGVVHRLRLSALLVEVVTTF